MNAPQGRERTSTERVMAGLGCASMIVVLLAVIGLVVMFAGGIGSSGNDEQARPERPSSPTERARAPERPEAASTAAPTAAPGPVQTIHLGTPDGETGGPARQGPSSLIAIARWTAENQPEQRTLAFRITAPVEGHRGEEERVHVLTLTYDMRALRHLNWDAIGNLDFILMAETAIHHPEGRKMAEGWCEMRPDAALCERLK